MKNIPVFILFLFSLFNTSNSFAQKVVEGTILTQNNHQAIPFAMIEVVEEGKFVYADEQGHFKINLADESSTLLITSAGFVKKEMIIPVQAKKTVCDIAMKNTYSTAKGIAKGKKGREKDNPSVVKQ